MNAIRHNRTVVGLTLVDPHPVVNLAARRPQIRMGSANCDLRRRRLETTLGSFLDTTADKLLTSGTLVALVSVGRASAWLATIIIGRELVIMGLRGLIAADGGVMKPSIWGKLKTNTQFVAILL